MFVRKILFGYYFTFYLHFYVRIIIGWILIILHPQLVFESTTMPHHNNTSEMYHLNRGLHKN